MKLGSIRSKIKINTAAVIFTGKRYLLAKILSNHACVGVAQAGSPEEKTILTPAAQTTDINTLHIHLLLINYSMYNLAKNYCANNVVRHNMVQGRAEVTKLLTITAYKRKGSKTSAKNKRLVNLKTEGDYACLLYTSPSPRD